MDLYPIRWLYTEHRRDRIILERETKAKAIDEEQDEKTMKVLSISERKESCAANGVENMAFETEHL